MEARLTVYCHVYYIWLWGKVCCYSVLKKKASVSFETLVLIYLQIAEDLTISTYCCEKFNLNAL
jgi:hypothetical protein